MPRTFTLSILTVLLFAACSSPQPDGPPAPDVPNKFSDSTLVRIYEAQDRRDAATLGDFLGSENDEYRAAAAEAFGTVQDSGSIGLLFPLLTEENAQVAAAAAWALGQIGKTASADALLDCFANSSEQSVWKVAGEAIGKCGDSSHVAALLELGRSRSELAPGAMQGLYRAGLRGMAGPETAEFAAQQLQSSDSSARLYAAAFFGRNRKLGSQVDPAPLVNALHTIKDPDVLQHLVRGLGRIENEMVSAELRSLLETEDIDYMVKVSAIRAMGDSPRADYLPLVEKMAVGSNAHVAFEAATYLKNNAPIDPKNSQAAHFRDLAGQAKHWRVGATLLGAAIKVAVQEKNEAELKAAEIQAQTWFDVAQSDYEKGQYILAMAESPRLEPGIVDHLMGGTRIVRTYAMEALTGMYAGTTAKNANPRIEVLKSALQLNDVAITAQVAGLIRQEKELLKASGEGEFLQTALDNLNLPQDIETYNEIERTLAAIRGVDHPQLKTVEFNNPIDWEVVKAIPRDQEAVMKLANGGEIRLRLFVEEAPGTVANFVALGADYFYKNAVFHRVVPNFVAQGGDPRGDGWGSTPNTIRSEWPNLHYGTGSMGMASAGKDTESCQWFITHCSTLHLDGRYTIFAKVTSGMEFLHEVNIGDLVSEITFPGLQLPN